MNDDHDHDEVSSSSSSSSSSHYTDKLEEIEYYKQSSKQIQRFVSSLKRRRRYECRPEKSIISRYVAKNQNQRKIVKENVARFDSQVQKYWNELDQFRNNLSYHDDDVSSPTIEEHRKKERFRGVSDRKLQQLKVAQDAKEREEEKLRALARQHVKMKQLAANKITRFVRNYLDRNERDRRNATVEYWTNRLIELKKILSNNSHHSDNSQQAAGESTSEERRKASSTRKFQEPMNFGYPSMYRSGLFTSIHQDPKTENVVLKGYDLQSIESQENIEYERLTRDVRGLLITISGIKNQIASHVTKIKEYESHVDGIVYSQIHPFRRDPNDKEISEVHYMKTEIIRRKRKASDMEKTLKRLKDIKCKLEKDSLLAAKNASIAREERKNFQKEMETTRLSRSGDEEKETLPMVFGESIAKSLGAFNGLPKQSYYLTTHASRMEILQAKSDSILSTYNDVRKMDGDLWTQRNEHKFKKEELNQLIGRVNYIKERVEKNKMKAARKNLNEALLLFFASKCKLLPVDRNKNLQSITQKEMTNSKRFTYMCIELENAKNSTGEFWDSGILLGSYQQSNESEVIKSKKSNCEMRYGSRINLTIRRHICQGSVNKRYQRDAFIYLLEKEIDLVRKRFYETSKTISFYHQKSNDVIKSENEYLQRKRRLYESTIKEYKGLSGLRIDLLEGQRMTLLVKECVVTWYDNGTKPKIEHKVVQIKSCGKVLSESPFMVCLQQKRFFVCDHNEQSKQRTVNKNPIVRFKNLSPAFIQNAEYPSELPVSEEVNGWFMEEEFREREMERRLGKENWEISQLQDAYYEFDLINDTSKFDDRHGIVGFNSGHMKGKAIFRDTIDFFSRSKTFRKRIVEIENLKTYLRTKKEHVTMNIAAHKDSYITARSFLKRLEEEFEKSANLKMVLTNAQRDYMDNLYEFQVAHAKQVETKKNRNGVEVLAATFEVMALKAQRVLNSTKVKFTTEDEKTSFLEEDVSNIKAKAMLMQEQLSLLRREATEVRIRMKGQIVHTRFGIGQVVFYRYQDKMMCVAVEWGRISRMKARVYIPLSFCFEKELKFRKSTRAEMAREDLMSHKFKLEENSLITSESFCMAQEEEFVRDVHLSKSFGFTQRQPANFRKFLVKHSTSKNVKDISCVMAVSNNILDSIVAEVLVELCLQTKESDKVSLDDLVKSSKVVFDPEGNLNFCTQTRLLRARCSRIKLLEEKLELWALKNGFKVGTRPKVDDPNSEEYKEKQRAYNESYSFEEEDKKSSLFQREEQKLIISTRKEMIREEKLMRLLMIKQEEIEMKAASSKYVPSYTVAGEPSANEYRRNQLKKGLVERKRIKWEIDRMTVEDSFSRDLSNYLKKQEQLRLLALEYEVMQDSGGVGDVLNSTNNADSSKRVPPAYTQQWSRDLDRVESLEAAYELEWITLEEASKFCDMKLISHNRMLKLLFDKISSQQIRKSTLHSLALEKRATSNDLVRQDIEAKLGFENISSLIYFKESHLENIKKTTRYMVSSVLNGYPQQWDTNLLHRHMIYPYMKALILDIVFNAELMCLERIKCDITKEEDAAKQLLKAKQNQFKYIVRKRHRKERLRLRRSVLCQQLFSQHRLSLLSSCLQAWRDYKEWYGGVRSAYQLKFEGELHRRTFDPIFQQTLFESSCLAQKKKVRSVLKV